MVNKDIRQIFEALINEATDLAAIKKKYDDALQSAASVGLSPEQTAKFKSELAQQWQAEKETLGDNAGSEEFKELDAILGTSSDQPPATPKPTPSATATETPNSNDRYIPKKAQDYFPQPTTQTPTPGVNVPKPGSPNLRPPVAPSPTLPTTSQPLNPQEIIDQEKQRAQNAEQSTPQSSPTPASASPAKWRGIPIPPGGLSPDANVKLRTGTYGDVPAPTTQTPTPGVNVPKPGTVAPAAATTPTVTTPTVAPAAPASGPEPVKRATIANPTPFINTTKGKRLITRR